MCITFMWIYLLYKPNTLLGWGLIPVTWHVLSDGLYECTVRLCCSWHGYLDSLPQTRHALFQHALFQNAKRAQLTATFVWKNSHKMHLIYRSLVNWDRNGILEQYHWYICTILDRFGSCLEGMFPSTSL